MHPDSWWSLAGCGLRGKAYSRSARPRKAFRKAGVRYRINKRGHQKAPLSPRWRQVNRARSKVRARGEHPFRVVKQFWGFSKVRYRGLANLYLERRELLASRA